MLRAAKNIETRGIYELFEEIASGGMATVRLARWIGHNGFSRVVAVKQLYPQFARDGDFVAMFLDEARLSARVRHPNVVPILDIVSSDGDLFLVMDYVHGESVSRLQKLARVRNENIPPAIACTILGAVMHGLHAAHEARTELGEPLQIIHRDVTPQNVLVGVDGCPRILDFGVAQAAGRLQTTRDGQLKGKLCYMAPEQLLGGVLDRRVDIYSASAMLWEMLAGRKLFTGTNEGEVVRMVLDKPVPPPSLFNPMVSRALDDIVLRGLQREPDLRFSTAREVALAIEQQTETVASSEVGAWVESVWGDALKVRTRHLVAIESSEKSTPRPETTDGAIPATASHGEGEHLAHAPGEDRGPTDRSTINTRRIVGLRSLLVTPPAEAVVAAALSPGPQAPDGKPAEGHVPDGSVPERHVSEGSVPDGSVPGRMVLEPRVEPRANARRMGRAGTWALATVAVAALAVVLVTRSSIRRSRDAHNGNNGQIGHVGDIGDIGHIGNIGLTAGATKGSLRRESSPAPGPREQESAPPQPGATPETHPGEPLPQVASDKATSAAPHSGATGGTDSGNKPAALSAVATPAAPAVKSAAVPSGRERVSGGKRSSRRRTLVARMAPGTGTRPRAERETPVPPRAAPIARSECDPPFIIDASGIKRMKVPCL